MNKNKNSTKKIIFTLLPFILVIIVMIPRLISPQFGFFDDARMLAQGENFLHGDFSMSHDKQAGRFRPIYWLYYTLIYSFAGYKPFWFFLGNLIIFLILLYQIRVILKKMGFADWQIFLTSLIFIFSMPIIENFYTLSKGEPPQLVFLLAAIIVLERMKEENRIPRRWILALLSAISILMATMIKETAVVMLPLTILWATYLFLTRDASLKKERKTYLLFLGSVALGVLLYFILRSIWGAPPLMGGTYTDRYLTTLSSYIDKILRWTTQFAFYFLYLIPVATIILLLFFNKSKLKKQELFNLHQWIGWCLLWFAILIPWEYAELYFLLPFGLGSAILIGLASPLIWKGIKENNKIKRFSIITLCIMAGLLFLLTLPNYLTDANTQLTLDRINHELLVYAVNHLPEGGSVFTNIETSNEYSEKLELFLREHYHRNDITYGNINAQRLENLGDETGAIILMPFIENQPRLTVRAGIEEIYQSPWNTKMLQATEGNREQLTSISDSFQIFNINLPILVCPLLGEIGFCENPDPVIDTRLLTYGWEVYQIK